MEKDFLLCPEIFRCFFWKNENFQNFKNFIKETLLWIFWIQIFLKIGQKIWFFSKMFRKNIFLTQKRKFLHGYSIFFIEIFFKIYLLYQSYPTHLLSTPESELGASGNENSVWTPEICQWLRSLQDGLQVEGAITEVQHQYAPKWVDMGRIVPSFRKSNRYPAPSTIWKR